MQDDKNNKGLTEKETRRLHWFVWIFLILSLFGMANTALYMLYRHYNPMSPAEFVHRYTKDPYKATKHVRVNGVDYDIPIGYFRWYVPGYTQVPDIALIVMRPDFTILPASEDQLLKQKRREETVAILAEDPTRMMNPTRNPKIGPDLDRGAEGYKEESHHTVLSGQLYGLEVYKLPEERKNEIWGGEPFIRRENGKVRAVIYCGLDHYTLPGQKPFRNDNVLCQHFFYDGFITYQIEYPKPYLKDWKETQDKVIRLFKDFRDHAKQLGLDKEKIPESLIDPMYYDTHPKPQNPTKE